jgi:ribosomal protein S18 acetylase RimI-like enzyme
MNKRRSYVEQVRVIDDCQLAEQLWQLYSQSFGEEATESPCRQSYDQDEFREKLSDQRVEKFVLRDRDGVVVGIGMTTNDLTTASWISQGFYRRHFPDLFQREMIYYILTFAISPSCQGSFRFAPMLYRHIIDSFPEGAIWCFDYSQNINPRMAETLDKVGGDSAQGRRVLDQQIYVMFRKGS